MLEWKVNNGDDKLKSEIKRVKNDFYSWYNRCWSDRCSKEEMLSESSPVIHVRDKMVLSFEEVKAKYPHETRFQCSSCHQYTYEVLETEFSFCNEYGCGMSLCKECATKLKGSIEDFIK